MKAKCIYEPRGFHGLEGYQLGESYEVEKVMRLCQTTGCVVIDYWKVSPVSSDSYFETCSDMDFKKYFEVIDECMDKS
jgi:hypothetical protein